MTIEEIGSSIAERLLEGAMKHDQFANYYAFLGFQGYKLCHEYHCFEENCNYRKFVSYFIQQYDKLISTFSLGSFNSPSIIPDTWYGFNRGNVDINTCRNAVKTGLEKYVQWEVQTKRFFEDMSIQAMNMNEMGLVIKLEELICDVEKEIEKAKKQHLLIKATDYDLSAVVGEQGWLIKKYSKKMERYKRKESDHDKSQRS